MQAGPPPEDLHAILSRFHTWAGKSPANGHQNGTRSEEIREIPYEEAIRQHRSRQAVRTRRASVPKSPAAAPTPTTEPSAPATQPNPIAKTAPPPPQAPEELPLWVANLPVIPDTEPVIDLNEVEADLPPATVAAPDRLSPPPPSAPAPLRRAKPSAARRPSAARAANPEAAEPVLAPAVPALHAQSFIDIPPAALAVRHRPQRERKSSRPQPSSLAAAAPAAPLPSRANPVPAAAPAPPRKSEPAVPPPVRKSVPSSALAPASPLARNAKSGPRTAASTPQTRPQSRPAEVHPRTSLLSSPIRTVPPIPPRARPAAPVSKPKSQRRPPKRRPQFRQVLASKVQLPTAVLAPAKKPAPDRTRRITTRFSPAEERRIEKRASDLGMTVSAYLRQCALATVAQSAAIDLPAAPAPAKSKKASPQSRWDPNQDVASTPSLLTGWLAMLRNRFLGPPIRFTEEA